MTDPSAFTVAPTGEEVAAMIGELQQNAEWAIKRQREDDVWEREGDKRKCTAADTLSGRAANLLSRLSVALATAERERDEARADALNDAAEYVGRVLDYGADSIMQGIRDLALAQLTEKTTQGAKEPGHDA